MTSKYLLAINTVNGECAVALSRHNLILATKKIIADRGHSEMLIPLIETILKESSINIDELAGFLVCIGPGNYTSLRVAISTARGLSLACKKPACGVSLFELLSTNRPKVLVSIKGPAEKVYVQSFSNGVEINQPKLMALSEIKETTEIFESETVGYKAMEIGNMINSKSVSDSTKVSFKKFVAIGIKKLKPNCPKPAPLYIK